MGPQRLKGVETPFRAWKVVTERRSESRFEALRSGAVANFVGREAEIEMLKLRWVQAKSGEGQVVLISGEAGIGKSHLARAFHEGLAGDAHTRLRYQCSPHHLNSAFFPFITQLELAAGFSSGDTASLQTEKLEMLLARGSEDWRAAAPLIDCKAPDQKKALHATYEPISNDCFAHNSFGARSKCVNYGKSIT